MAEAKEMPQHTKTFNLLKLEYLSSLENQGRVPREQAALIGKKLSKDRSAHTSPDQRKCDGGMA